MCRRARVCGRGDDRSQVIKHMTAHDFVHLCTQSHACKTGLRLQEEIKILQEFDFYLSLHFKF